jgi:hypothetical protein
MSIIKKKKGGIPKITTVTSKQLFASFKVAYRITKCKNKNSVGENLELRAAINIVETVLAKSFTKRTRKIPLADNTVGRKMLDISEDL